MSEAFVFACQAGDIAAARQFLAQGGDPNSETQGYPALWCAAQKGHTEVLQLLLGGGSAARSAPRRRKCRRRRQCTSR